MFDYLRTVAANKLMNKFLVLMRNVSTTPAGRHHIHTIWCLCIGHKLRRMSGPPPATTTTTSRRIGRDEWGELSRDGLVETLYEEHKMN